MPGASDENRRSTATLVFSVLLHAALIFLLPGVGAAPSSGLAAQNGVVSVTLVEQSPVVDTKSKAQATTSLSSKPVTTQKPKVAPVKPAVITQKAAPKSAVKTVTATANAVTPKNTTTKNRVLTSDKGSDTAVSASVPKREPIAPVATKTTVPTPAEEQPAVPAEPAPPIAGSAVSGFGQQPRLSGKETEEITDIVRLKVVATVSPDAPLAARLQSPSNNPALASLERLAVYWVKSERYMKFQRISKTYEVVIDVVVDPDTNSVTFRLAAPSEQVRIIR